MAKPRRSRTYCVQRIKATYPYAVPEIAKLLGVHKNAVLRWLKQGLEADHSSRPALVRGEELIRFLTERQQARRRKCSLSEFFCFKCRTQREALPGTASVVLSANNRLRVTAQCFHCCTAINKVQSVQTWPKIRAAFNFEQLPAQHLRERAAPSVKGALTMDSASTPKSPHKFDRVKDE